MNNIKKVELMQAKAFKRFNTALGELQNFFVDDIWELLSQQMPKSDVSKIEKSLGNIVDAGGVLYLTLSKYNEEIAQISLDFG